MSALRVGRTATGWVPYYPAEHLAGDYLARCADHFDVVEVDSTYYRAASRKCSVRPPCRT
ncbi:MAG: DUF72 domain-containing protein [Phycisphaerae bacterium]